MCDKAQRDKLRSVHPSGTATARRTQHSEDVEKLKSQVRLCVMRILTERLSKPAAFSQINNVLVTELIVEYLEWMGYNRTLDTFSMECRIPKERNVGVLNDLPQELNCPNENGLPRIFQVMNMFKETSGTT